MIYDKFEKLNDGKHGRAIKALIGIPRSKFDKLAVAFAAAYPAIQQERLEQGEIKQVPSGGPKGNLDSFGKKLFFLLFYLKTYPPSTCWASILASVPGMPTTMWRTLCPSCYGACRILACCLRGRRGLPRSSFNSLRSMATSSSTGWSARVSGRRTGNSRRPASAERKNVTCSRPSSARPCTGKSFSSSASSPEASTTTRY